MTGEEELRVLVVDDDVDFRTLLSLQLNLAPGIDVVGSAADGREAIDLVESQEVDAVAMDLLMPRMNGFEAIAILRDEPCHVERGDHRQRVEGVRQQTTGHEPTPGHVGDAGEGGLQYQRRGRVVGGELGDGAAPERSAVIDDPRPVDLGPRHQLLPEPQEVVDDPALGGCPRRPAVTAVLGQ